MLFQGVPVLHHCFIGLYCLALLRDDFCSRRDAGYESCVKFRKNYNATGLVLYYGTLPVRARSSYLNYHGITCFVYMCHQSINDPGGEKTPEEAEERCGCRREETAGEAGRGEKPRESARGKKQARARSQGGTGGPWSLFPEVMLTALYTRVGFISVCVR